MMMIVTVMMMGVINNGGDDGDRGDHPLCLCQLKYNEVQLKYLSIVT